MIIANHVKLKNEKELCVKGIIGLFFFLVCLYVSEPFESIETHIFFSKNSMSTKPKGAKRPRMRV